MSFRVFAPCGRSRLIRCRAALQDAESDVRTVITTFPVAKATTKVAGSVVTIEQGWKCRPARRGERANAAFFESRRRGRSGPTKRGVRRGALPGNNSGFHRTMLVISCGVGKRQTVPEFPSAATHPEVLVHAPQVEARPRGKRRTPRPRRVIRGAPGKARARSLKIPCRPYPKLALDTMF